MNRLLGIPLTGSLPPPLLFQTKIFPSFFQGVRAKSKKAQSSKRNPSQAPGKHYGIKVVDGDYVKKNKLLVKQNSLRYHGGLNVGVCGRFTLMSLAEGKVIISCEKPDVDWTHSWNRLFYSGREGVTFYKKYLHVIPDNPHIRFKVIESV